jgi:hypothetical protein
MHFNSKGLLSLAIVAAAAISNASINYNNIVATVSYDGGATQNLTVIQDGNSISFVPPPPMIVSTVGPFSAVVNISYDVTTDKGINGLDLIFTGSTMGTGRVDYSETVKDSGLNTIASVSNSKTGDGAFTQEDFLKFANGGETSYSVSKTFDLNLGQTTLGQQTFSSASIGLVEQNAVPEPASMTALAIGGFGMLARRRRKIK